MDRLECWSAVAAGLCSLAAMVTVGVPAYMHYNQVDPGEWRTAVVLIICAGAFFATSLATGIVNGVRHRREDRQNGVEIKEE